MDFLPAIYSALRFISLRSWGDTIFFLAFRRGNNICATGDSGCVGGMKESYKSGDE